MFSSKRFIAAIITTSSIFLAQSALAQSVHENLGCSDYLAGVISKDLKEMRGMHVTVDDSFVVNDGQRKLFTEMASSATTPTNANYEKAHDLYKTVVHLRKELIKSAAQVEAQKTIKTTNAIEYKVTAIQTVASDLGNWQRCSHATLQALKVAPRTGTTKTSESSYMNQAGRVTDLNDYTAALHPNPN